MSVGMEEIASPKPRKRPAAKAPTRTAADKVKVSIVLSADVDFRLSVAAAALRMDRRAPICSATPYGPPAWPRAGSMRTAPPAASTPVLGSTLP
jgi:hypothetical protein